MNLSSIYFLYLFSLDKVNNNEWGCLPKGCRRMGPRRRTSGPNSARTALESYAARFSISAFEKQIKTHGLSGSKRSIADYLRHLEEAFFLIVLEKFDFSPRKRYPDLQSRRSQDTGGSEGRPYSGLEMVIKKVTDSHLPASRFESRRFSHSAQNHTHYPPSTFEKQISYKFSDTQYRPDAIFHPVYIMRLKVS